MLEVDPRSPQGRAQIEVMATISRAMVNGYSQCGRFFHAEYEAFTKDGTLPEEGCEEDYAVSESILEAVSKLPADVLRTALNLA